MDRDQAAATALLAMIALACAVIALVISPWAVVLCAGAALAGVLAVECGRGRW